MHLSLISPIGQQMKTFHLTCLYTRDNTYVKQSDKQEPLSLNLHQ